MISCSCRLISHCITKNIRTFFSTPTLSIDKQKLFVGGKHVADYWGGETKTRQHKYQMLQLEGKENVRALLLTDPLLEERAYCCVRVGVGSNDDPDNRAGVAHLVEHIIASYPLDFYKTEFFKESILAVGTTDAYKTLYHFDSYNSHVVNDLKNLWPLMFWEKNNLSLVTDAIIKRECHRINLEFHEWKKDHHFFPVEMVIKSQGLKMLKFGVGNWKTLMEKKDIAVLKNELLHLYLLYRQRPVFVCIYSGVELKLEDVYKSLETYKPLTSSSVDYELERNPDKKDFNQNLFVVQSCDDALELKILFPFDRVLNLKELRTFEILTQLLNRTAEGSLRYYVFVNRLAYDCSAFVVRDMHQMLVNVQMTEEGLENIKMVRSAIFQYLKLLLDDWKYIDYLKKRFLNASMEEMFNLDGLDYAEYIADKFNMTNDEFDEKDLFETLDSIEDQENLLKSETIQNKNVVYSIRTRDIDMVGSALKLEKVTVNTEEISQIKFKVFDTVDLETGVEEQSFDFKITDTFSYLIPTIINNPKDVVYRNLCLLYLKTYNKYLIALYSQQYTFRPRKHSIAYDFKKRFLQRVVEHLLGRLNPCKFDHDEHFDFVKNSEKRNLAILMSESHKLARSLLDTAIENIYTLTPVDPVPMQYNTLRTMTKKEYNKHFKKLSKTVEPVYDGRDIDKFIKHYDVKSMDKTELCTVTYHFFVCNKASDDDINQMKMKRVIEEYMLEMRNELGLYISDASQDSFGTFTEIDGILLKVTSLESNGSQAFKTIAHKLTDIMNKQVSDAVTKSKSKDLQQLYDEMMAKNICIQIVGHDKIEDNGSKFDSDFSTWFTDHEKTFEDLVNVGKTVADSSETDSSETDSSEADHPLPKRAKISE